jgi:hypothetical protein
VGLVWLVLLISGLILIGAKAPLWIVTGERPTDVPREWPRGVQESDSTAYAVERIAVRTPPPPPERYDPPPASRVEVHVSVHGR